VRALLDFFFWLLPPVVAALAAWFWSESFQTGVTVGAWAAVVWGAVWVASIVWQWIKSFD
jgi:hypothetical protein